MQNLTFTKVNVSPITLQAKAGFIDEAGFFVLKTKKSSNHPSLFKNSPWSFPKMTSVNLKNDRSRFKNNFDSFSIAVLACLNKSLGL